MPGSPSTTTHFTSPNFYSDLHDFPPIFYTIYFGTFDADLEFFITARIIIQTGTDHRDDHENYNDNDNDNDDMQGRTHITNFR